MFQKILIANRGEIAVRIIRTCRVMGIRTVALYSAMDRDSLHVRLADECLPVESELRYGDPDEVLALARRCGADAVHPGYGFLAERPDFVRACEAAGITFIGPPPDVIAQLQNKLDTMEIVQDAGFNVPSHSEISLTKRDGDLLSHSAHTLGFPIVIKSCGGGRGRGSRVVYRPEKLAESVNQARREALKIYGNERLYLERAIAPSHYIAVQIMADDHGSLIHLGERECSLLKNNQNLLEESPAPCLNLQQRERIWQAALNIAGLFDYHNVGAVEFLVDDGGRFYFTEIKARIQVEHPVSEIVSGIDIVREQIRIAAGYPLPMTQDEVTLSGVAMQCRINAEDPWHNFLPSPGRLDQFRLPAAPNIRVDTYGYAGYKVPVRYDSLLANLAAWGSARAECITRLQQALDEFVVRGVRTNIPLHLGILNSPAFQDGLYDTGLMGRIRIDRHNLDESTRRDLAVAAAVAYVLRNQAGRPTLPQRTLGGWHRSSRYLPA